MDLFRRAREADVARRLLPWADPGHDQRRIPEGEPAIPVDHMLRELHAKLTKRRGLLLRESSYAGRHVVFRPEVLSDRHPLSTRLMKGQLAKDRLAGIDGIPDAKLGCARSRPRHDQVVSVDPRRQTGN